MSLLIAAAMLAAPLADRQLAAKGKWAIDRARSQCLLSRSYGSEGDRLTLAIVGVPGRALVDLVVIEPDLAGGEAKRAKLSFTTPTTRAIEGDNAVGGPASSGGRFTRASISREQLETLRTIARLSITIDGRSATLDLSDLPAAFKALAECEADLLRELEIDPASLAKIKTPPTPAGRPGSWLTDADYPRGALRRGEQGTVTFRLIVAADGSVRYCSVLKSSGSRELDDAVCQFIPRRARFNPARDAIGVAVPSVFTSRFFWVLPR